MAGGGKVGARFQVRGVRYQAPTFTGSVSSDECRELGLGVLAAELSLPPSFFQLAIAGSKDLRFAPLQLVGRPDVANPTVQPNSIVVVELLREECRSPRLLRSGSLARGWSVPKQRAPATAMSPIESQTISSQNGEPNYRAMPAGVRNWKHPSHKVHAGTESSWQ